MSNLPVVFGVTASVESPAKPTAVDLAAEGVEIVGADTNGPSTLAAAVEGVCAVFGVTGCEHGR
ncbi:hypothetical protein BJY00DRAFT_319959 [Aspergillus carlsbadensis]|nr:hypothetical protein BJY00DRAFT_319959 [Aspergillus carlsbadensis]